MVCKKTSATPFAALICPLDGGALLRQDSHWRCEKGHCFDIAKEGYVNLLPVQNKRSRDPGDSKEMILARRRFLNAGHYQKIANALSARVLEHTSAESGMSCLDAGCGEGYYLRELIAAANGQCDIASIGLDISKWAVISAAKQSVQSAWVVGSNANLPMASQSIDVVLCMFGFPVYAEFARVLKPGGILVLVESGFDHLRELREIIYPEVKVAEENAPQALAGFEHGDVQSVKFNINLDSQEQIADLLVMTPHLYRASAQGREKAAQLTQLSLTIDATISVLQRTLS